MVSFISVGGLVLYFERVSMLLHYGALYSGCTVINSRLLALKGLHSLPALCCNNGSIQQMTKKKIVFLPFSSSMYPRLRTQKHILLHVVHEVNLPTFSTWTQNLNFGQQRLNQLCSCWCKKSHVCFRFSQIRLG